jgi:GNAT superfamily N-acetyltransferase
MTDLTAALEAPSTYFRSTVARGIPEDAVDQTGGDFDSGLIRRTAVITRGEALGHGMWIDDDFLHGVAFAINESGNQGIKARFTHPDMSGDGLGSSLGRIKDARVEEDRVLADLHLSAAAHNSPDGDLAGYVMDMAIETPEQFGQSINFLRDVEQEEAFLEKHGAVLEAGTWGPEWNMDEFESPDPANVDNLRHARLHSLSAVDSVDEPAANPEGLFHRGRRRGVAREAEQFLDYALGLSATAPALTAFSMDPDRVRSFFTRYADRRGISITETDPHTPEDAMSENTTVPEATPETETMTQAEFATRQARYTDRFGAENGAKWFGAGMSWEEALSDYAAELEDQLAAQTAKVVELNEALTAERTGEDPMDLGPPAAAPGEREPGRLGIQVNGTPEDN